VLVERLASVPTVPGLNIERVINTRALILKLDGQLYLYASGHWYASDSVDGIWDLENDPPAGLEPALKAEIASQNVDLMTSTNAPDITPQVYLSTIPAELIQTRAVPTWSPLREPSSWTFKTVTTRSS